MIVGIKKNLPVVVRAVPENKATGDWRSDELIECFKDLPSQKFLVGLPIIMLGQLGFVPKLSEDFTTLGKL